MMKKLPIKLIVNSTTAFSFFIAIPSADAMEYERYSEPSANGLSHSHQLGHPHPSYGAKAVQGHSNTGDAVIGDIDPILGAGVDSIIRGLHTRYPFVPDTDLGSDLITYLKGSTAWDNYLTPDAVANIEKARTFDREALTFLGTSFKSGTLPSYSDDLVIKLLTEAASRHSAPALYSISRMYKDGFGPIHPDAEKARILYEASISINDPSVEEVRRWLELE